MENTTHALMIAASVLLSVMIIALAIYVFRYLGTYQKAQDSVVSRENLQEFNESFEVYNKQLMYGTDVLSCLNQAENNNQKYVYDVYYGVTDVNATYSDRAENIIQVNVILHETIQESVKVYYQTTSGTSTQLLNKELDLKTTTNNKYTKLFNSSGSTDSVFELPSVTYYYFSGGGNITKVTGDDAEYDDLIWDSSTISTSENKKIKSRTYNTTITGSTAGTTYSLVATDLATASRTGSLIALLSTVTQVTYTTTNEAGAGLQFDLPTNVENWTYAEWVTAVYDFKTRKFKCTDMSYSETGYVNSITFEEVTSY